MSPYTRRAPLILVLASIATPFAVAIDLHVATTGDDATAAGTPSKPYRTINRALQTAQPGDTIVIHDGVYDEGVRVLLPNITLRSADNERATIRGPIGTGDDPGRCVMFDVDASGGTLQRLELIGGYYTVFLQSRWDWGGPDRSGASDILIEDCKIHDSGRDCVKITPNSNRVTIRRCEIYRSGQLYPPGTPFDSKNAEGIDSTNGDQVLVQDCYVHDVATTGVYFKGGATDCVIERTGVARCGQAGVLLGFDTSPEFFDLDANPQYYECIRGTVRNCIIEDTDYAGIGFYAADGALAANNTIINAARVGHSPIYFGVTLQDYYPDAGRPASVNVRVVNNIVVQTTATDAPAVFVRYLYEPELGGLSALAGMPDMRNNLYFNAAGARFADARPQSTLAESNLTAWQSHIVGDKGSFVSDPLLSSDGRLTSGSPAIGRGATLDAASDDIDGQPRPGAVDIGADQFDSGAPDVQPPDTTSDGAGSNASDGTDSSNGGPGDGSSDVGDQDHADDADVGSAGSDSSAADASPNGTNGGATTDGGVSNDVGPFTATAGICPMTAVAGLTLSLVGMRRSRRRG